MNIGKSGWRVEHECPQCGGTVDLEEAQRLFSCPYCRVRLFIAPSGPFQYFLSPAPGPDQIFFAPYRRFKGMRFSYVNREVVSGLIDISRNVSPLPMLPPSLGLRSGTQKIKFVSASAGGAFFEPAVSPNAPLSGPVPAPQSGDVYIGEAVSFIYTPVYFKEGAVWDGILREKIAPAAEEFEIEVAGRAKPAQKQINFIPSLCPDCGWNLEGEPPSVVLVCRNCSSAWNATVSGFERVACAHTPLQQENILYLPFWKIESEMEGVVRSYADAVRTLNLPKVVKREWEAVPFTWMIPAFKINPEVFLRISRVMSLSLPAEVESDSLPEGALHPVTLPLSEAFESLAIAFVHSAVAKADMALAYPRLKPILKGAVLTYRPFLVCGTELIRPDRRLSINVNALKWGAYV